jgi:hypothetical protein
LAGVLGNHTAGAKEHWKRLKRESLIMSEGRYWTVKRAMGVASLQMLEVAAAGLILFGIYQLVK